MGAGPAGLSTAHKLGLRGYEVALAEAHTELGGRVAKECRLPGLAAWGRVRDYRQGQIQKMSNVEIYRASQLTASDILEMGFSDVALATGATWRADGVARFHTSPIARDETMPVFTPDDVMNGAFPTGHVVIFDDDHYYMGSVLAELLVSKGCRVTFVTPSSKVSEWSSNTLEQALIQRRLLEIGVGVVCGRAVSVVGAGYVQTCCIYTGRDAKLTCDAVLMVTSRSPNNQLHLELVAQNASWKDHGILSVKVLGDAQAPAPIAWATYAGHRYAEEFDAPDPGDALPFRREVASLQP